MSRVEGPVGLFCVPVASVQDMTISEERMEKRIVFIGHLDLRRNG
jgi:hypothetical protein